MKSIWKYPVEGGTDIIHIEMPKDAEIISMQVQHGTPCIWAIVDDNNEKVDRVFEIIGTGHSLPELRYLERKFIDTFQVNGGSLVFHLFELIKTKTP